MNKPKQVNIKDVARAAGVSITTVSRVINNSGHVKEKSREKILEVIQRLDFKPNIAAQRLASRAPSAIGLEVPRYEGFFYSFYGMEIFRAVGIACEALKVDLLLHLTDGRSLINTSAVGGVVFADVIGNQKHVEDLLSIGMPVVLMNYMNPAFAASSVSIDNTGGAQTAVEYLIQLGHRQIACLTGDLLTQAASERLEGYKRALAASGLGFRQDYVFTGDYSRKSARSAAEKISVLNQRPSAIFVCSDDMAMELIAVLSESGQKVPRDISVIGFDDDPVCLYGPVNLTTMRQPLKEMAASAVKELYLKMRDKTRPAGRVILSPELIIRDSVRPQTAQKKR